MAQSQKTAQPQGDPGDSVLAAMTRIQRAGFGPMGWLGTAWLEGMGELQQEVAQFVADRIAEDVRTQHEILHCKSTGELREIQTRFLKTAIEQYTAETGKLVQMSNDMLAVALKKPAS